MNQQKSKKKEKTNKNGDNENVRGNPLRDLPEWLEEFTENLVDESVPAHRDAPASSSRESASEPRVKVMSGSGKHSIHTHFPKDKDCEICKRTKITRAPCRKRTGTAVPRAENIGDLITADHKVLSEGCESRNNHLICCHGTRSGNSMDSIKSVQNQNFSETERAYKSSWSRRGNPKSFTLTISWNLAKLVKVFPGIIVRQHLTVQKQMGLQREQYAGLKKGDFCCTVAIRSG